MEKLTYRQFLKTDVDLSPLGVMRVDAPFEPYFCTPKGARVFGRSGVDGIHFCFVRGFGAKPSLISFARSITEIPSCTSLLLPSFNVIIIKNPPFASGKQKHSQMLLTFRSAYMHGSILIFYLIY